MTKLQQAEAKYEELDTRVNLAVSLLGYALDNDNFGRRAVLIVSASIILGANLTLEKDEKEELTDAPNNMGESEK